MQRYASFVKFEADMHQINLLPVKGPPRHIHQAKFIVTDEDVDAIVNLWLEEWHGPFAEPLPQDQSVEEPSIYQVQGEEQEGYDTQGDPWQENLEDDDDTKDSYHHPST